jgi:tetratricopeptide (TPR) repeat protein
MSSSKISIRWSRSNRIAILFCVFASLLTSGISINAQENSGGSADDAVALFNQGQESHSKGDLKGALSLYEKALRIVAEFPEAEFQRGHVLLLLGRADDAEAAFRRSVELREDWSLGLAGLGSVLLARNKPIEAEPFLVKALAIDPMNFPAFTSLVELRLVTGAKAEILREMLASAVSMTSKANPTAALWSARGLLERALGDTVSARSSIAKALSIDANSVSALSEAAHVALENNDPTRAEEYVARLETVDRDSPNTKLLRARSLAASGRLDEAAKVLEAVPGQNPAAQALRDRIAVERSADPAELERQLSAGLGNEQVLGRLCGLYRRSDPAKALEFCRRASEAEPSNIDHAIGFGAALVQAKRYDDAVNFLRKLADLDKANSTIRANLATALFQLRRYREAKVEYRWLLDNQPNLYTGYYFLGITHDRLEEFPDAMANYLEFLKRADPVKDKEEIERTNLRLPALQKQLKSNRSSKK